MAPQGALNATRQSFHIDSGYLSDALKTSPSDAKLGIASVVSSPPDRGLDVISAAFDDTNWDFRASELAESPTLRPSLKRRKIPSTLPKLKHPKRYPIAPLDSTLARARNEAMATSSIKKISVVPGKAKNVRRLAKTKSIAVDTLGRTRAARKILESAAAAKPTFPLLSSTSRKSANTIARSKKTQTRTRGDAQRCKKQVPK